LDQLITRRYRLEEINKCFKDLAVGKHIRGMIIY
jgi:Zn-dependent alcohol dehydrogenase